MFEPSSSPTWCWRSWPPSAVAGDLFGPRRVWGRRGPPQPPDDSTTIEGEIVDS